MQLNTVFEINPVKDIPGVFSFNNKNHYIHNTWAVELIKNSVVIVTKDSFPLIEEKAKENERIIIVNSKLGTDPDEWPDNTVPNIDIAIAKAKETEASEAFILGNSDLIMQSSPKLNNVYYSLVKYQVPMKDAGDLISMAVFLNNRAFVADRVWKDRGFMIVEEGKAKDVRIERYKLHKVIK